jgi:hypothetical protein
VATARLHTLPYTNLKLALASAFWTTLYSAKRHDAYAHYSISSIEWRALRAYRVAMTCLCAASVMQDAWALGFGEPVALWYSLDMPCAAMLVLPQLLWNGHLSRNHGHEARILRFGLRLTKSAGDYVPTAGEWLADYFSQTGASAKVADVQTAYDPAAEQMEAATGEQQSCSVQSSGQFYRKETTEKGTQRHHLEYAVVSASVLRASIYAGFYFLLGIGALLTVLGGDLFEDNIVEETLGENNPYVFFVFTPSTYVVPIVYTALLIVALLDRLVTLVRLQIFYLDSEVVGIGKGRYRALKAVILYQMFSFLYFAVPFAVQPNSARSLRIHSWPFFNLQIALGSIALMNMYIGYRVGKSRMDFSKPVWALILTFPVLLTVVTLLQLQMVYGLYT